MTYQLSKPQRSGSYLIAVLSRQHTMAQQVGASPMFSCKKQPSFVLLQNAETLIALDMSGATVPIEVITDLCPDAIERMSAT